MSQKSSINFKPSTSFQVFHNSIVRPNYAIGGELISNRNGYEALELKEQIIENAKEAYTKNIKQKFQATSYEWSAVCNIKEDTTMQDLERLAEHFETKYGFQCYQISIHRDEGHINDEGEKVINHHAHLEFITLDKYTGKNCFKLRDFPKSKMREIQDEVAKILNMERGQDKRISKRERIEPRKYAQMKEAERKKTKKLKTRLENLEEENKDLNRENNDFYYKNIDLEDEIQAKNQEIQELKTKNQELEAELEQEKLSKNQLEKLIKEERKAMIQKNKELEEANQQKIYNADDYKKLRELKEKQDITIAELNAEIEKIKQEAQERESKIKEIFYDEIDKMEAEIKEKNEVIQTQNQQIETLKAENNEIKAQKLTLTQDQIQEIIKQALEQTYANLKEKEKIIQAQNQEISKLKAENNNYFVKNEDLSSLCNFLQQQKDELLKKIKNSDDYTDETEDQEEYQDQDQTHNQTKIRKNK